MTIAELHEAIRRRYPFCPKCEYVITVSGYCPTCGWESDEYKQFKEGENG